MILLLDTNINTMFNANTAILSGAITLVGAFITAYFTSLKTVKTERDKINSTIELTYANKLLEKRLVIYPEFYFLLSELAKALFYKTFNKEVLIEFQGKLNELDSKYMIFCSSLVTNHVAALRRFLRTMTTKTEIELSDEERSELITLIGNVENTLKHDLGVYIVELDDPTKRIDTTTYDSVKKHYHRKRKLKDKMKAIVNLLPKVKFSRRSA